MQKKWTIGPITAGFQILLALIVDGLQFLLTVSVVFLPISVVLSFFSMTVFFLWFALCGVKYNGGKGGARLMIMLATTVAELAPVISAIPATTLGVIGVISLTYAEDILRHKKGGGGSQKARQRLAAEARAMRRAQAIARINARRAQEQQRRDEEQSIAA